MANMMHALTEGGIVLAVVLALSVPARADEARAASPTQPPTLIFVTRSGACDCVASLCVAAELQVRNFLADDSWGFTLKKVDLTETPEAAKALDIPAVPVVFLMDGGAQVARFDGFVDAKEFRRTWEAYWNGEKK